MKQFWLLVLFVILLSPSAFVGYRAHAELRNSHRSTERATFATSKLDIAMTDAEILAHFNLDIARAEVSQVQGKDGLQTTYIWGDRRVNIVRSKVSGLSITAEGINPVEVKTFKRSK